MSKIVEIHNHTQLGKIKYIYLNCHERDKLFIPIDPIMVAAHHGTKNGMTI